MDACWAGSLGGCSQKLSREHLVSAGLFTEGVEVHGFPWCKDKPVRIGISSLTKKILCEKHNNALSPIDSIGQSAFVTMQEFAKLSQVRRRIKTTSWTVRRYCIDGCGLERWFLKTLINLCSGAGYPIGGGGAIPGIPSDRLIRIAFELETFETMAGLYLVSRKGMAIIEEDVVSFAPLIAESGHILGGTFTFRGFRFLLYLESCGPPIPLFGVDVDGEDLQNCTLAFHARRITESNHHRRPSQIVQFRWT
jgi:hypothetical protein